MKYLPLVLRNIGRNKRRTILTTLSIAVGLLLFSLLMSLPALRDKFLADRSSSLRLLCHSKAGPRYTMPEAYRVAIARVPHVEAVAAFTFFGGIYHETSDQFPNLAIDFDNLEEIWPDWGISHEEAARFSHLRTACLAGAALMQRFNWHVGQRIILRGTLYPVNLELEIVGTLGDRAPPVALLFRRDYLEEALGNPGAVNIFWVKVDRSESIPAVIAGIDETFSNSAAETRTESESSFFSTILSNFSLVLEVMQALAVIVVLMIGLVAANSAAMSVRERRSEIAVMRSIGFTRRIVLACLLSEGLMMGVVGGLLGCGAAYLILKVVAIGSAALGPLGLAAAMRLSLVVESLVLGALIGALSLLIPALATTRQNIVDQLRTVG